MIKIAFLKEMLFRLVVDKVYWTAVERNNPEGLLMSAEDRGWFEQVLKEAVPFIALSIEAISGSESVSQDEEGFCFTVVPTSRYQRLFLADLLEKGLVAFLTNRWFSDKGAAAAVDLNEVLLQIKSVVLKTDEKQRRNYSTH